MADKEAMHGAANQASGWADSIKERSKHAMEWLHESRTLLLDILLYGGLGFLSGFLLRKYSNYVAFLVLVIVGIIILQQWNVMNVIINWSKINDFFGFQHAPLTLDGASFNLFWEWCKVNMAIVVSYIVGLLIGLRIG